MEVLAVSYIPVASVLLLGSVFLSAAFFVYGLNTLYLTIRSKRYRQVHVPQLSARPTVAIHLPIYNEFYVVGRLLASCARAAERYGPDHGIGRHHFEERGYRTGFGDGVGVHEDDVVPRHGSQYPIDCFGFPAPDSLDKYVHPHIKIAG